MSKFLASLSGIMIALMVLVNGTLGENLSITSTLFIIHLTGLFAALVLLKIRKEPLGIPLHLPWHYYISGLIGLFLVFSNNICFSSLGVTLTLALGLFGQSIFSLLIDSAGLFNRVKRKIQLYEISGILVIALGLYLMF